MILLFHNYAFSNTFFQKQMKINGNEIFLVEVHVCIEYVQVNHVGTCILSRHHMFLYVCEQISHVLQQHDMICSFQINNVFQTQFCVETIWFAATLLTLVSLYFLLLFSRFIQLFPFAWEHPLKLLLGSIMTNQKNTRKLDQLPPLSSTTQKSNQFLTCKTRQVSFFSFIF